MPFEVKKLQTEKMTFKGIFGTLQKRSIVKENYIKNQVLTLTIM